MTLWWRDLRFAIRALARTPLYAGVAALTIALAIGANTVLFGIANPLVVRALDEVTGTAEWRAPEGFLARLELRRDWSTVPVFGAAGPPPRGSQTTATIGLVWWVGTMKGAW